MTPKTGDDRFTHQGHDVDANLLGLWRWSCSNSMGNVMRGVLAEYTVGLALGCVDGGVRPEWDATDLLPGLRVEVKSSASLQSWSQTKLSPINFDIEPKTGWYAETNTYATERNRQADVFVCCVLTHTDKATVDPLDVDQWDSMCCRQPIERCGSQGLAHAPTRAVPAPPTTIPVAPHSGAARHPKCPGNIPGGRDVGATGAPVSRAADPGTTAPGQVEPTP